MLSNKTLSQFTFSELEKVFDELTQLQQENLKHLFEIETTRLKVLEAKVIAQIEAKVYSSINKYFK